MARLQLRKYNGRVDAPVETSGQVGYQLQSDDSACYSYTDHLRGGPIDPCVHLLTSIQRVTVIRIILEEERSIHAYTYLQASSVLYGSS